MEGIETTGETLRLLGIAFPTDDEVKTDPAAGQKFREQVQQKLADLVGSPEVKGNPEAMKELGGVFQALTKTDFANPRFDVTALKSQRDVIDGIGTKLNEFSKKYSVPLEASTVAPEESTESKGSTRTPAGTPRKVVLPSAPPTATVPTTTAPKEAVAAPARPKISAASASPATTTAPEAGPTPKPSSEAAAMKDAMAAFRGTEGLKHLELQKRFPSYNQFYGALRAYENRLTDKAAGKPITDAEIVAARDKAQGLFLAFKNEVVTSATASAGSTGTTSSAEKQTLGRRFASLVRAFAKDETEGVDAKGSSGDGDVEAGKKQWEARVALKKDWQAKRTALFEQIKNQSLGQDVRTLGFSAWRRHGLKREYDAAKKAYMGALAPHLQHRESREQLAGKLREGSYRPYFAQRFVLDDGNMLLGKQSELLSPKKRELIGRLQDTLKKNRTAIRIGLVSAAALATGGGALVAGAGLGAALGVGALAGASKSARMLVSAGSAAFVGGHVFNVLDARVDRKKEALSLSVERTQRRSYDELLASHDQLVTEYVDNYDAYKGAQTTRTVGTVAAAAATGIAVSANFDSIVDAIDRLDFIFGANDPHLLNAIPTATDLQAGFTAPDNLPVAESLDVSVMPDASPETLVSPVLTEPVISDTVPEAVTEVEPLVPEAPAPEAVPEMLTPEERQGAPEMALPADPTVPAPELAPESVSPGLSNDAAIPETGFEDRALTPSGLDGSVVQAETGENQVGSMLENLSFNEYVVHSGDPGVSYELVKHYPDIFKDLSREEWNEFIAKVNSEPQLLQAAGVESGDLNTVFDGNKVRLDLLAEYKINGQVSAHLSAVESSPIPPERPLDLTATELAPAESTIPPERPSDLLGTESAPTESPISPARPEVEAPDLEAVPEAVPAVDPIEDMDGPDYASSMGAPETPAAEVVSANYDVNADNSVGWASATEAVSDTAQPLPDSITEAVTGVPEIPPEAKEAFARLTPDGQAEFAARVADNTNMSPTELSELANLMAAREEAVGYINASLGIEIGHGLDAVGHVKSVDLQRALENNQLPQFLREQGVTNVTPVAETIKLMQECRLLPPGSTLNQALERAFMENNMRFNTAGDELVVLKPGLFGPKEFEVALTNPKQQYA